MPVTCNMHSFSWQTLFYPIMGQQQKKPWWKHLRTLTISQRASINFYNFNTSFFRKCLVASNIAGDYIWFLLTSPSIFAHRNSTIFCHTQCVLLLLDVAAVNPNCVINRGWNTLCMQWLAILAMWQSLSGWMTSSIHLSITKVIQSNCGLKLLEDGLEFPYTYSQNKTY